MKYWLWPWLILLMTTSCFQKDSKNGNLVKTQSQSENEITPEDFINLLEIKIEVYLQGPQGSYLTGEEQDHQSWTTDAVDNFEGSWISNSKRLGDFAFKYKFSLREDGQISLEMDRFKAKANHKSSLPFEIGKFLGSTTFIFKDLNSIAFKLDKFDNSAKVPIVAFTPNLKKIND